MSTTDVYDSIIPFFGYDASEWPQMRLFLNLVKDNYNYNLKQTPQPKDMAIFAKRYYPEIDAKNFVDPETGKYSSAPKGTASKQFRCFLKEWMEYLGGTIGLVSGQATVITAAEDWNKGREGTTPLKEDGSPANAKYGLPKMKEVLKAYYKSTEHPWVGPFMDAIIASVEVTPAAAGGTVAPAPTVQQLGQVNNIDEISKITFKVRGGTNTGLSVLTGGPNSLEGALGLSNLFTDLKKPTDLSTGGYSWEPSLPNTWIYNLLGATCQYYRGLGKPIGYSFDKYILRSLLDSAMETSVIGTSFFDGAGVVPAIDNKYYRKPGDKANIYTEIEGKEVAVQKGSDEYMKLVMGDNCFNLGVKVTDAASKKACGDFIMNCLAGKDIEKCKDYMLKTDFWKDVNQEVSSMNPDLALEILSKFGFPTYETEVSEVGLKLKMFGNSSQWLETLKNSEFPSPSGNKSFTDEDIKKISSNRELIGYLDAVSAMVNRNPGILNSGYAKGTLTSNVNAFEGTTLSKYGLQGKYVVPGSGTPSVSSIIALQNAVIQNRSAIAVYYGIPFNTTGYTTMVMRGGGSAVDYFEAAKNPNVAPARLSSIIEKHIEGFVGALKNNNKDLDEADKTSISKLISELKSTEDKLYKAAIYTSKYMDLISVFGQEDTNGLITLDHLQQFVDKRNNYFEKVGTKTDTIMSIAKTLAEAVQKELNLTPSKAVSAYPTPKN